MRTGMAMPDSRALYRLMSWLSPGFPVGAFAYSHGLETAVESGRVRDAGTLTEWVKTVLLDGTGRTDGVLFREAWQRARDADAAGLEEIAGLGHAFQPGAEIALESRAQGAAFLAAARASWPAPGLSALERETAYPVAVALACAAHGIALEDGLAAYFHGIASNLVSAGVRLIPLGQTDGQAALAALEPAVTDAVHRALVTPLDDLGTAAPVLDLDSFRHETQYTRLFRS